MYELICDATELNAAFGADAPDTFILGGYTIDHGRFEQLYKRIEDIKRTELGSADVPVKWNVRDIDRALRLHGLTHLAEAIKKKSDIVRSALLSALRESGATFFLSAILAYSNNKQVLGKTKDDLVRYSFSNFLMRTGLLCQQTRTNDVQLTLDWPDANKRQLFVDEYLTGWRDGKSFTGEQSVDYDCGPLRVLGYRPGPLFGVTDIDPKLQLADLCVGAYRSFIDFCMGSGSKDDFGVQQFKALIPSLYCIDGWKCFGRGISVAPTRSKFSELIYDGFNALK